MLFIVVFYCYLTGNKVEYINTYIVTYFLSYSFRSHSFEQVRLLKNEADTTRTSRGRGPAPAGSWSHWGVKHIPGRFPPPNRKVTRLGVGTENCCLEIASLRCSLRIFIYHRMFYHRTICICNNI